MSDKPDCLCFDCVVKLKEDKKTDPNASIDCACEGAGDTYEPKRCNVCPVKQNCDIFEHPELYI